MNKNEVPMQKAIPTKHLKHIAANTFSRPKEEKGWEIFDILSSSSMIHP